MCVLIHRYSGTPVSLAITSVPVLIHSTCVKLMPMLLLILNDGKLFWVIVLLLDIVCLRIAKIMYALMSRTSCMQGKATATLIAVPPTHVTE